MVCLATTVHTSSGQDRGCGTNPCEARARQEVLRQDAGHDITRMPPSVPNRLIDATSPYLRQHADNPVDWYPWGPEALERARRENRPILLSIGYAACHWCHVMAHESFEDPETAALMNALFVNIKVDREERPDLDAVYMQAVQAMTGQGGWPMTVMLTPDGHPFFGGTYFPPEDRHGLPAFRRVLRSVAQAWHERPEDIEQSTSALKAMYARQLGTEQWTGALSPQLLEHAAHTIAASHDRRHGGFGAAPKFPQPAALDFMLRHWRRTGDRSALALVHDSFLAMARGGINDQVGGGFHRYSTDATWLVPHFEKMLYDNALLLRLAVHLWQATGDAEVRRVAQHTLQWLHREMSAPNGGFHSSLDADSDGEEGSFYLWSADEFDAVLGDDAQLLRTFWGVSNAGNFEGRNILHVAQPVDVVAKRLRIDAAQLQQAIGRARTRLCEARERRLRPARDDKIVACWNGLALRAVALAARAFADPALVTMAQRTAQLLLDDYIHQGRVLRIAGRQPVGGFLDDHAAVGLGLLELYQLDFDDRWRIAAGQIADSLLERFLDAANGRLFDTASDAERLVSRPRELMDNPTPSGTALAVELLLRLAELHDDASRRSRATQLLESLAVGMEEHGLAFGHLLGAADLAIHGATEIALVGDPAGAALQALAAEIGQHYIPELVLAGGAAVHGQDLDSRFRGNDGLGGAAAHGQDLDSRFRGNDGLGGAATHGQDTVALLVDRPPINGAATAYVCRRYVCDAPATNPAELRERLTRLALSD